MSDVNHAGTSFIAIYNSFFSRVTDDMYLEFTELETFEMLQDILINAIPRFEFPRFDIFDYEEGHWEDYGDYCGIESENKIVPSNAWVGGTFNVMLTQEEINILSLNMVIEWLGLQLNTTKNTEQLYAGSDFKFTSQANHMAKLKVMIDAQNKDSIHLQRIYKRRKFTAAGAQSTMGQIVEVTPYGVKNINRVGSWTKHDF